MPFSERNRNRHILKKEDFANLAVFQLIQEYWLLVEDYIDDENVIYYFWVANNKKWIIEFLGKKWPQCLPPLAYVFLRLDQLHPQHDPTPSSETEQYFENLLKYKKMIKKRERRRYKHYLKRTKG